MSESIATGQSNPPQLLLTSHNSMKEVVASHLRVFNKREEHTSDRRRINQLINAETLVTKIRCTIKVMMSMYNVHENALPNKVPIAFHNDWIQNYGPLDKEK